MAYHPASVVAWGPFGEGRVFRFLPRGATHPVDGPWPTGGGRFDDGDRATLYVSTEPEAAVAEYLRRHPELIEFQEDLKLDVFEFDLFVEADGCDVRTQDQRNAVGISIERLTSADTDEHVRYAECREFAAAVDDEGGVGIAFPSAALEDGENIVLFHPQRNDWWTCANVVRIATPRVEAGRVRPLA